MFGKFSTLCRYYSHGGIARLSENITGRRLITSNKNGFYFTNPSICVDGDGILLSVRRMNNPIQISSFLGSISYAKKPKTGIELCHLDFDLSDIRCATYVDAESFPHFIADARIFLANGLHYHIGTYMPPAGAVRPAILTPSADIIPLALPFPTMKKEKNWTPVISEKEGLFLCQPFPPVVREYSLTNGTLVRGVSVQTDGKLLAHGGTGPIRTAEGWLVICRERFDVPRTGLVYTQRAIFLDDDFNVKWITGPWVIDDLGIEVVNGAAIAQDRLYLAWGRDDREAHVAYLPLDQAIEWFRRVVFHPFIDAHNSFLTADLPMIVRPKVPVQLFARLDRVRRNFDRRYQ